MTTYQPCIDCELHQQPCNTREAVKAQIAGLRITSINWKCVERVERFPVGSQVWCRLHVGCDEGRPDEHIYDNFPGLVVRRKRNAAYVRIEAGVEGEDETIFEPRSGKPVAYIRLALSRLANRDGRIVELCDGCPYCKGKQRPLEICEAVANADAFIRPTSDEEPQGTWYGDEWYDPEFGRPEGSGS